MRTIYVCSAGFGEGHHSAARAVVAALGRQPQPELRVEFLDLSARVQPRRDALMRWLYLTMLSRAPKVWARIYDLVDSTRWLELAPIFRARLRRALLEAFRAQPPAAVVLTFPFYGCLLDEMEQRGFRRDFPRIVVVTDSISINSIWFRYANDCYLVPNEETAEAMRARGVPPEKLHVTGFPVHPCFADGFPPRPAVTDPTEGRRVLFIVNSRRREAPETVRRILAVPGVRLTVTAGRDESLREQIEAVGRLPRSGGGTLVRVLGWTKEIPNLLAAHHVVVTKAGGATTQEAIAAACPLIMSQVAPGQEEGNAIVVLQNDAGVKALTPDAIGAAVAQAFAGDAAVQRRWAENIARISRPAAALEVAEFIRAAIARSPVG